MSAVNRRAFLKVTGAAAAGSVAPACTTPNAPAPDATVAQAAAPTPRPPPATPPRANPYTFFQAEEGVFIEAAVERLIPADDLGPGAIGAGVPAYMDRQLAGAWGAGERLYRGGPWQPGKPTQGYQLPYTPAELFRHALRGVLEDLRALAPKGFAQMSPADQDAYLKALEGGERRIGDVPSNVFFGALLEMTIEGFFADPAYGGNRDAVGWKLVGFPGAYANYYDLVDQYGIAFTRPPMSLAQDASGTVHVHPVMPAQPASKGK